MTAEEVDQQISYLEFIGLAERHGRAVRMPCPRPQAATPKPAPPVQVSLSKIYFARRECDGLIKIGTTSQLGRRLSALRRDHGTLTLLATQEGGFTKERALHERFAKLRVEGEWFRSGHLLTKHIKRLASKAATE